MLEEDEKTAGDMMHTYMLAELEKRCRGLERTLQMLEEEKSDAETKCMVIILSRVPLSPIPRSRFFTVPPPSSPCRSSFVLFFLSRCSPSPPSLRVRSKLG